MKKPLNFFLLPIRLFLITLTTFVLGGFFILFILLFGRNTTFKYTRIPFIWGKLFCLFTGVSLSVTGEENIPKGRGVVFIFSHASFLDIPIIFSALPQFFNFAAKSYVFKIPIIGQVGRAMKTIEISKDLNKSIQEYKRAEELIRGGESFMIAPEGTRSDTEVINSFKSGPFLFAMNANADILPVVIYGASKIWSKKEPVPNLFSCGGLVRVHFMPLEEIKDFKQDNRKEKAEKIRQKMIKELDQIKKEKVTPHT